MTSITISAITITSRVSERARGTEVLVLRDLLGHADVTMVQLYAHPAEKRPYNYSTAAQGRATTGRRTGKRETAVTLATTKSGKRDLNPRPSPWQASAGRSHPRLGRAAENQQGQNSASYPAPNALPLSPQDHPGHLEPRS